MPGNVCDMIGNPPEDRDPGGKLVKTEVSQVRKMLIAAVVTMAIVTGCQTTKSGDAPWYADLSGTYKGTVGGNADPITLTLASSNGVLAGIYTINDPEFSSTPYKGSLSDFKVVEGKTRTLSCRYKDEMNDGSYELTFSEDFKTISGSYEVAGEGYSDANTVYVQKK